MSARVVDFPADLAEWEGWCLELVDDLLHKHPDGDILYVDLGDTHPLWAYHAALVLDGIVYDAWHPHVRLPPAEYVERVFGADVTWEINPGSEDDDLEPAPCCAHPVSTKTKIARLGLACARGR